MIYRLEIRNRDDVNVLARDGQDFGVLDKVAFDRLTYRYGMNFQDGVPDFDEISYYQAAPMAKTAAELGVRDEIIDELLRVAENPSDYREMYPFIFIQE